MRIRVLASVVLVIVLGAVFAPLAEAATAKSLAQQLLGAGLGCESPKARDFKMWNGTAVRCTVNGEDISLETYARSRFKDAMGLACSFGLAMPVVSDGRSWGVATETRATALQIRSVLGGRISKPCSLD